MLEEQQAHWPYVYPQNLENTNNLPDHHHCAFAERNTDVKEKQKDGSALGIKLSIDDINCVPPDEDQRTHTMTHHYQQWWEGRQMGVQCRR